MDYKYVRENDTFIWQGSSIRFELSNPKIQGFEEFSRIKGIDDILHYYYDMKVCRYNSKSEIWESITEVRAFDFPAIAAFKNILECLLDENPKNNGMVYEYDDKYEYKITYDTGSHLCEDFYETSKVSYSDSENIYYDLSIGASIGYRCTNTVHISYIDEECIKELLNCINKFINYSIDIHNEDLVKYQKLHTTDKEIVSGKVYEYLCENNTSDKSIVDAIYMEGDKFSNITEINPDDNTSETYRFCTINKITKNSIIIDDETEIPINRLLSLFRNVPDDMLAYGIDDIVNDFLLKISESERSDFQDFTQEKLLHKYKNAFINRAYIYREEHNFPVLCENDVHKNADEIVKLIIRKVKEKL